MKVPLVLNESLERIEVPDRNFPCEILLPAKTLAAVSTALDGYGEIAEIHVTSEEVSLFANNDMATMRVVIADRSNPDVGILCANEHKDRFKTKYVLKMSKAAKLVSLALTS
jgi:DNA polymerase III sliding clamp (beta) subunit (PCNA family)